MAFDRFQFQFLHQGFQFQCVHLLLPAFTDIVEKIINQGPGNDI